MFILDQRVFVLSFVLLTFHTSFAQLDSIHWIPPLHCRDNRQIQDHYIYLSTPIATPFVVTITDGAGTILATPTISNASPYRYTVGNGQLSGSPSFIPIGSLNKVLKGKGLILTAKQEFFANLRARAAVQAECLTAKGRAAFGTTFRVGGFPQLQENSIRNFTAGVMATEPNTTVTISGYNPGVLFAGSPYVSSPTITVILNKGESYVVSGYTNTPANRSGFIGALVKSDKPIVLNNGNLLGTIANNNSSQDMGMDQSVPIERIGKDYILIEGNGVPEMESPIVIAHSNNTQVFINGNPTPVTTINAGQFYLVPNTYYQGTGHRNMYIHTSEPAYMYQALAGATAITTPGLNFIPPFSCYLPTSIDFIPAVNMIGSTTYTGGVMIFTRKGAILKINNVVQTGAESVKSVPWETYKIMGLTGSIKITSTSGVAAAIFGASGDAGFAGYFAGFSSDPSPATFTLTNTCSLSPTMFNAQLKNNVDSLIWNFGDKASGAANTSSLHNPSHTYNVPGTYSVQLITYINICSETVTKSITILPVPSANFSLKHLCIGNGFSFSDSSTIATGKITGWQWDFGDGGTTSSSKNASHQYSKNGIYSVQEIVTSDNGCTDTSIQQIQLVPFPDIDSAKSICKGDSIQIGINPSAEYKYNWLPSANLSSSIIANPIAKPLNTTSYTLTITDINGCKGKDSVTITMYPLPSADAGMDKDICIGDSLMLKGSGGNTYLWKPSVNINNTNSPNPIVYPSETTTYTVIVTDTNTCTNAASVIVRINSFPKAGFEVVYTPSCEGIRGEFTHTGSADTYLWDFGDGTISEEENPIHLFSYNQSYSIKQVLINNAICKDTSAVSNTITSMNDNIVATYPNVFTPNNDGVNDFFIVDVKGQFHDCSNLIIFNRWGTKMFNDKTLKWNGKTTAGKEAPDGVYFYLFKINNNIVLKGSLSLIR